MPIKVLKRNRNVILESEKITIGTDKVVYPFVISKSINKKYYIDAGQLFIPIIPNKDLVGAIYIQAYTPNFLDYCAMDITVEGYLYELGSEQFIIGQTLVASKDDSIIDFKKIDINIPAFDIGTKEKLGLFIKAKNTGTGLGSYNSINLAYFEKNSQGE